MRLSFRLVAVLAFAVSAFGARADTYQIFNLGTDETQFYGLDDFGHVSYTSGPGIVASCPQYDCYQNFTFGVLTESIALSPNLTPGPDNGTPCTLVSSVFYRINDAVCNNGRAAVYAQLTSTDQFRLYPNAADPALYLSNGYALVYLHMNARGDVAYANGALEILFEAYDLSTPVPAPEPSSIALLGTGLLGIGAAIRRRLN